MDLEERVVSVERECSSLREALAAAVRAIETLAQEHERDRAIASVNAELVARNVALTGAAAHSSNGLNGPNGPNGPYGPNAPTGPYGPNGRPALVVSGFGSASAPAGTVVVRDDALGVALLGNSATYAMRLELKRYGSWVTDAPARWVVPKEVYEQNRTEWSTRFGVTFAKE